MHVQPEEDQIGLLGIRELCDQFLGHARLLDEVPVGHGGANREKEPLPFAEAIDAPAGFVQIFAYDERSPLRDIDVRELEVGFSKLRINRHGRFE